MEYLPEGGREGAYVSICELLWETSSETEGACEYSSAGEPQFLHLTAVCYCYTGLLPLN